MFYDSSGIKVVPDNIAELLTFRGLAYWFMDDGYLSTNGFYFCTESYSINCINKLVKALTSLGLDVSMHKHTNGQIICINNRSRDKFT